jgi:hypothetical protein
VLNVHLTVDTELWPFSPGWPRIPLPADKKDFSEEIANYLYGKTSAGNFGVPYQIGRLNKYGLKATYFVDPMFAQVVGKEALRQLVSLIQDGGQEVQVHMHTEWLGEISDPLLPRERRQNIGQYSESEQTAIIGHGINTLRECGATSLVAFRAGNFGANLSTLRAAKNNGLSFDSSHNTCFLGAACDMEALGPLTQPKLVEGIMEFPISFYSDYSNHLRHAQLGACSFAELQAALLWAWREGWHSFVILLHGTELVRHQDREGGQIMPNSVVVSRFDKLCQFLNAHSDKFSTVPFCELDPAAIPANGTANWFRSSLTRTLWRHGEQFAGRFL